MRVVKVGMRDRERRKARKWRRGKGTKEQEDKRQRLNKVGASSGLRLDRPSRLQGRSNKPRPLNELHHRQKHKPQKFKNDNG